MKRLTTLAAAAMALIAPASALAENIQQEGFIKGDKAAPVKLRVKVDSSGDVKKVGGFRAQNVVASCDGEKVIRIQLTALTPVPVERDNSFKVRLSDGSGGILRITGEIKDGGRVTVGNLKTNEFESGKLTCRVSKQRFATSAGSS